MLKSILYLNFVLFVFAESSAFASDGGIFASREIFLETSKDYVRATRYVDPASPDYDAEYAQYKKVIPEEVKRMPYTLRQASLKEALETWKANPRWIRIFILPGQIDMWELDTATCNVELALKILSTPNAVIKFEGPEGLFIRPISIDSIGYNLKTAVFAADGPYLYQASRYDDYKRALYESKRAESNYTIPFKKIGA